MNRWLSALVLTLVLTPSAIAAPPPAPQEFVYNARRLLTTPTGIDVQTVARLFANDVVVFENGKTIATGKDAWLKLLASSMQNRSRRVVLHSQGYGDLLIVDTYDTVDRTNLPPNFLADPRPAARSILYQFGADELIHIVRISSTAGFWAAQRN
jgi:hypothetical protein